MLSGLKITHLSTSDIRGGAAKAAFRLHREMTAMGCDSRMVVKQKWSDDPTVSQYEGAAGMAARVGRIARRQLIASAFGRYRLSRPLGYEAFDDDRSQFGGDGAGGIPESDIYVTHFVAGFVDSPQMLPRLVERAPVVWRIADMHLLTGGCHYDDGCGRYRSGCGKCPQLGSTRENDLSRRIWERRKACYDQLNPKRFHLVALSRWMEQEILSSPLLRGVPVSYIPNGVDTEVFAPRDKELAREILGIPKDRPVVLFVSDRLDNRRKGLSLLGPALREERIPADVVVVSVGEGKPATQSGRLEIALGGISNERYLALVYSAADVFVIPSLQDNQPNTVLESMACGTPVVGFRAGGIRDMVEEGKTGALVEVGDAAGLGNAIASLLRAQDLLARMGRDCRNWILERYARRLQVEKYLDLFQRLRSEL